MKHRHIVIIGPLLSGKSECYYQYKKREIHSFDTDLWFEEVSEMPITQQFNELGAIQLRRKYFEVFSKYFKGISSPSIIFTGATLPIHQEFATFVKRENCFVVVLLCSAEVALERLRTQNAKNGTHAAFPLLFGPSPKRYMKMLYDYRREYYEIADYSINTDRKSIAEVVKNLDIILYKNWEGVIV